LKFLNIIKHIVIDVLALISLFMLFWKPEMQSDQIIQAGFIVITFYILFPLAIIKFIANKRNFPFFFRPSFVKKTKRW